MAEMRRIAFWADAPRPGGHEAMALRVIDVLRRSGSFAPLLLGSPAVLSTADAMEVPFIELPFSTGTPLPFLRNLNPAHLRRAAALLRELAPDSIVVVQGHIEMGLKGLIAARTTGRRTVSYLPFAYRFSDTGAPLGRLRDLVDRVYYRLPHAFLTVSEAQAARIRRFTDVPIHTVTNPVDAEVRHLALEADAARDARPEDSVLHVGTVGRVYLPGKNQDVLVRVAALARRDGRRLCVHVIGGGPDLPRLRALAHEAGLTEAEFRIHGHLEREEALRLAAREMDVLVIPSRFEGVPLVLLEAAALGAPFLVARREFSAPYALPESCLIDPEDPRDILRKLDEVRSPNALAALAEARGRILERHTSERFEADVLRAFNALSEN